MDLAVFGAGPHPADAHLTHHAGELPAAARVPVDVKRDHHVFREGLEHPSRHTIGLEASEVRSGCVEQHGAPVFFTT